MKLLILGGSDAGISAALRARELSATASVTVVLADSFPSYSICGLPFYLSHEVPDWPALAHHSLTDLQQRGLHLRLEHTAQAIDPALHSVLVTDPTGKEEQLTYDRLILATGATPRRPALPGFDLPGVYVLHTMYDSFAIERAFPGTSRALPPSRGRVYRGGNGRCPHAAWGPDQPP